MSRQTVVRGTPDAKVAAALAHHQAGDYKKAERAYRRMLRSNPVDPQALHLLGLLEHDRGKSDEAVKLIRRAIQYYPTQPLMYLNLGVIFEARNCYTEAIAMYNRALRIDPTEPIAHFNLGVVWGALAEPDMAISHFRQAIALDPTMEAAAANLIYQIDLSATVSPEEQLAARRAWNDTFGASCIPDQRPHTNNPDPARRLRIGYVSADFRQHSAWMTFSGILINHDRSQFEVYCYSGDRREDHATALLQTDDTVWRRIADLNDAAVARMIREDGIDILVDLSGYTAGNRMGAFARKPAPIQATGWGYATGTGLDAMDAFMCDPVIAPPEWADRFSETLVYLPSVVAYNHPSDMPDVSSLPVTENDGVITFGSFNQPKKLSTKALTLWARVLNAVPNSRLILRHSGLEQTYAETRVRDHFEDAGIETGRVHIFGGSSHWDHVAAFTDLDIQLDPTPASGGMTTLEGLWMGVPTLTLYGDRAAGRISASIMTTLGMADWIAADEDEYVRLAVEKAADTAALAEVRAGLRDRLRDSVICDVKQYVPAVERAFRRLWQNWCEQQRAGVAA